MKRLNATAPLRVLVVDDSQDMCESTVCLLRLWGHDSCVAADGPSALEQAASFCPDVVLLDLSLPGMDGCEVARRLRKQLAAQPMVVSMSGYCTPEIHRRALEAGCDLHWAKPTEPEDLRQLLESRKRAKEEIAFATDWSGTRTVCP